MQKFPLPKDSTRKVTGYGLGGLGGLGAGLRRTCRGFAELLSASQHCPVQFSQPLPAYAAQECREQLLRRLRQLTFPRKLQLLTTAADNGCEVNMAAAWDVVRPCLFPDLLPHDLGIGYFSCGPAARMPALEDPGSAAVRAGHLGMLPWMVRNSYPLCPDKTLVTAAQHCNPAQMQTACNVLWDLVYSYCRQHVAEQMAHAACAAAPAAGVPSPAPDQRRTDDARAKVGLIMQLAQADAAPERRSRLLLRAAEGAAEAWDMELLQWLVGQGLELAAANTQPQAHSVLVAALQGAHLEMADWLVAQAGWDQGSLADENVAGNLWRAAAGGGSVHSMQWLLGRGVAASERAAESAAREGHLEAVRFLHVECRQELSEEVFQCAAESGSVEMGSWLLQRGCPMSPFAHVAAARHEAMTRWLAVEAGCPTHGAAIGDLVRHWERCVGVDGGGLSGSSSSWTLLQAVKTILDAGHEPDASALDGAAEAGDLELLRYLQERYGLPYGQGTLAAAARGGCEEVVEWLVVQGGLRPGECWGLHDPHTRAAQNGDLSTLQLFKRLGVAWAGGDVLANMDARECLLPTLRWLAENCCGEGEEVPETALEGLLIGPAMRHAREVEGLAGDVAWVKAWVAERRQKAMARRVAGGGEGGRKGRADRARKA